MSLTVEQKIELYSRAARSSADAALDESNAPELRAYYAKIALLYDKRVKELQHGV